MEAVELTLQNAASGQHIAALHLQDSCTLSELHREASLAIGGSPCFHLLFNGIMIVPGPQTLLDHGLAPAAELEVVRSAEPAKFHNVGRAYLSENGICFNHVHDTIARPASSEDPDRCYGTYCGSNDFGNDEIAIAYIEVDGKTMVSDHENDSGIKFHILQPVPQTFHHDPWNKAHCYFELRLLGVDFDACPWLGKSELYHDVVRTEAILCRQAGGFHEVLWCQQDDVELRKAFNGSLAFSQVFFTCGHLYALATCTIVGKRNRREISQVFLEGSIDKCSQAPRLKFERWCQQGDVMPAGDHYEFVGIDAEETGLWLELLHFGQNQRRHNVVVLPFGTLEARHCLCVDKSALHLPGKCRKVCLDPLSCDLYLLQDRANEEYDRCRTNLRNVELDIEDIEYWEIENMIRASFNVLPLSVYRVRPAVGTKSPESRHLVYEGAPPELICCSDFGVDDSFCPFCVTCCAWYVAVSETFVVLDGENTMWALPLSLARFQGLIEEPAIEEPNWAQLIRELRESKSKQCVMEPYPAVSEAEAGKGNEKGKGQGKGKDYGGNASFTPDIYLTHYFDARVPLADTPVSDEECWDAPVSADSVWVASGSPDVEW